MVNRRVGGLEVLAGDIDRYVFVNRRVGGLEDDGAAYRRL